MITSFKTACSIKSERIPPLFLTAIILTAVPVYIVGVWEALAMLRLTVLMVKASWHFAVVFFLFLAGAMPLFVPSAIAFWGFMGVTRWAIELPGWRGIRRLLCGSAGPIGASILSGYIVILLYTFVTNFVTE